MMKPTLTLTQHDLVSAHLGLVDRLVGKRVRERNFSSATPDDLRSEGYMALIEAAIAWDPDRGVKFETFAWRHIQAAFIRADRAASFAVSLPKSAHETIERIRKAHVAGAETPLAVSEATGINVSTVTELWPYRNGNTNQVGATLDGAVDAVTLLADERPQPEDQVVKADQRDLVREAVDALPNPHRDIIRARFGFTTGAPLVSTEIAELLALDVSIVQRCEQEAFAKLETTLTAWGVEPAA